MSKKDVKPQNETNIEEQIINEDIQDANTEHKTEPEQDLLADLQRVQADFVNFKRSVDSQLAQAEQRGQLKVTVKFLDIIDDIERALSHVPENLQNNPWVQGLKKVYQGLLKKMTELKLNKIEALGADFNPELHEAVMRGDTDSEKVTEVLKNGYTYEGVVVRHAMVKVG